MNIRKNIFGLFFVAMLPVAGYAVMHLLVYMLPMSLNNGGIYLLYTVLIIALGLAVPYWMLKIGTRQAHKNNPQEIEMELKDIPKDKQQMAQKRG